jgi:hypothetical protein
MKMELLPKGLNPFKIQTKFKIYFLPEIVIQNPFRFWSWGKKENCSPSSLLPSKKVTPCLNQGSYGFSDFKVDYFLCTLKIFGKSNRWAATQRGLSNLSCVAFLHVHPCFMHATATACLDVLPRCFALPCRALLCRCRSSHCSTSSSALLCSTLALPCYVATCTRACLQATSLRAALPSSRLREKSSESPKSVSSFSPPPVYRPAPTESCHPPSPITPLLRAASRCWAELPACLAEHRARPCHAVPRLSVTPRCYLRASRQCPGVHLDATPSIHCQGWVALCYHQAATTLHQRLCAADVESALPVPLLPCLSLPLPCARCSRQCLNCELHQSRPPNARCYDPKVISLGSVHFCSFGLWHVGSHSPFWCWGWRA